MFLTNVNLVKIFVCHIAEAGTGVTVKDMYANVKRCGVGDVSVDLLSKVVKTMVEDELLSEHNGKYLISEFGRSEYERNKENLSSIVRLLFEKKTELPEVQQVPNIFDSIKAFKTIPYRADAFGGMDEEDFFRTKIQTPYRFEKRGMGKARLNLGNAGNEYSYEEYAVLFFNAGLVQFVGIVDHYDNSSKSLWLAQVIRLNSPLTILEIRENVRADFNGAQQKQEFFVPTEVASVATLIRKKIAVYGYENL